MTNVTSRSSRRRFLASSATALGIAILVPLEFIPGVHAKQLRRTIERNWAGNLQYSSTRMFEPSTVEEVRKLVRDGKLPKALGSRHSFSTIADTVGDHISTKNLKQIIALNREAKTVTVGGGIRYGELSQYLQEQGFALRNLASLPHISVVGACATGTHGSGDRNGNLATSVNAFEMVTADGELVKLSRAKDGETFQGAVVALGALGLITNVSLDVVPTYNVRQLVYEYLPISELKQNFERIMSSAYSVSLFLDWNSDSVNQVWQKHLVKNNQEFEAATQLYGAKLAPKDRHPIVTMSSKPCTPQMGVIGAWHDRLPHFKMEFTPSSGKELQSEFFIPREQAVEAIAAIYEIRGILHPVLQISEIRTVASDKFWMSPAFGRETVTIHFTWTDDGVAVRKVLPVLEAALAPFKARPHWGKLFAMTHRDLAALYPKMADFQKLANSYDPKQRLRNEFLNNYVFENG